MNISKNEINLTNDSLVSFVPMDAVGEFGSLRLDEEKDLSEIGSVTDTSLMMMCLSRK